MTLPRTVLFPQSTLPLFIFEPRYRHMLADVMEGDRVFAIATRKEDEEGVEPYHPVGTLGLVQTCQKNEDGTSSLLLVGLLRVIFVETVAEKPYRKVMVRPIETDDFADPGGAQRGVQNLRTLVRRRSELQPTVSPEILRFFEKIEDPEILADIVTHTVVEDPALKLRILGTCDLAERYRLICQQFRKDIAELEIFRKLKGPLDDHRISHN